jgi:hypothetical protein
LPFLVASSRCAGPAVSAASLYGLSHCFPNCPAVRAGSLEQIKPAARPGGWSVTTSPHTNGRAPAPLHDFDRRASPSSSNCESRRRRAGRACTLRVCATGRSVCGRNDPAGLLDLTRSRVRSESGKRTCACVQTARASGSSVDRPAQARDRPRQFGRRRW